MEEIPFDSRRRLCPDGACVGIIGADGRCSVCRRPAGAAAAWVSEAETQRGDEADEDDGAPASASASASDSPAPLSSSAAPSAFDPNRRLCDDGSCVGIVGADGTCGTCGRRAE